MSIKIVASPSAGVMATVSLSCSSSVAGDTHEQRRQPLSSQGPGRYCAGGRKASLWSLVRLTAVDPEGQLYFVQLRERPRCWSQSPDEIERPAEPQETQRKLGAKGMSSWALVRWNATIASVLIEPSAENRSTTRRLNNAPAKSSHSRHRGPRYCDPNTMYDG